MEKKPQRNILGTTLSTQNDQLLISSGVPSDSLRGFSGGGLPVGTVALIGKESKRKFEEFSSNRLQEIFKKSELTPEFKLHKRHEAFDVEKILKQQRKKEREKTKSTEMCEEVQRELLLLQMRSVWNTKRFYKRNNLKVLPKYFQVGKVLNSPLEYYNKKSVTKKKKKESLLDEVLAKLTNNFRIKRTF